MLPDWPSTTWINRELIATYCNKLLDCKVVELGFNLQWIYLIIWHIVIKNLYFARSLNFFYYIIAIILCISYIYNSVYLYIFHHVNPGTLVLSFIHRRSLECLLMINQTVPLPSDTLLISLYAMNPVQGRTFAPNLASTMSNRGSIHPAHQLQLLTTGERCEETHHHRISLNEIAARVLRIMIYRKIYHIRRTRFQNWNVSHLVLQLPLSNPLKPVVK